MAVHLITGDDESLLLAAVSELVHRLVGEGDRSLMVDEFDDDDYEVAAVVDAAQTSPFLTELRVVVARGLGRFSTDDIGPLVAYIGDPLPTTELVLVAGGGRLPKALGDAVKKAGGSVVDTAPPMRAGERSGWFEDQVAMAGLRLDHHALVLLASWLGE
ncbi:MAG: DNA polymerase III subunit delta, partial [Ilumatobacteraceae bacterium]